MLALFIGEELKLWATVYVFFARSLKQISPWYCTISMAITYSQSEYLTELMPPWTNGMLSREVRQTERFDRVGQDFPST